MRRPDLALFDFDGTITVSDTWAPFIRFATPRPRLLAGQALLSPVTLGYLLGAVSASTGRRVVARTAFQGADVKRMRELGAEYAATVLPGVVRQSALERIEWHKRQEDDVVIVSASLDVYIRPWCEAHGVQYICTTLEDRAGRLTGRCVDGDCSGAEKARRIQQRYDLSRYGVVYAYGDSDEDAQMLALAHRKWYRWREMCTP